MNKTNSVIKVRAIQKMILLIRSEKVIIDADLAEAYGVTTKALNQAIRRNSDRFPADFMFRLNKEEKAEVVTNCDHLQIKCGVFRILKLHIQEYTRYNLLK